MRTQTETTSQPLARSAFIPQQTGPGGGAAGDSRSDQTESIEVLMYRLNRALVNLPTRGGSVSSSDVLPSYDQL